MRHKKKGRKFGREKDIREAFLKSLVANLILNGKIKTTEARAKEIRGLIERLITKTKKGNLANIRYALEFLPSEAVKKLTKEVAPKYLERNGGYTRIIKIGARPSDRAKMVVIELV